MVDNQHKKIKGYRDLSEGEIALMNETKELAEQCGNLIAKIEIANTNALTKDSAIDMHWLNIGKTDIQKGFMAIVRSIAKPESF